MPLRIISDARLLKNIESLQKIDIVKYISYLQNVNMMASNLVKMHESNISCYFPLKKLSKKVMLKTKQSS